MGAKGPADATLGDAPEEVLTEIGRVVTRWGLLEHEAHNLLREMLRLSRDKYEIVKPNSTQRLVDNLKRVGKDVLSDDAYKALNTLCKDIHRKKKNKDTGLLPERNAINHDLWWNVLEPPGSQPFTHTLRDGGGFENVRARSAEELRALADRIESCAVELVVLRFRQVPDEGRKA